MQVIFVLLTTYLIKKIGDIADQFYIILKGRVLIYIPKQSYNILEERKKNLYEAENIEKCLKSMKKLITGKKNQEGGLHLVSYKTNAILPRRSTILDFSRRTLTANNRELISNSNFIKDQIKRSFSEVDPMYKSVLKITLFETIKIEDLDAPWNYFTDGVLHYDVANVLKEGDYFGELGLLTKKPRKATVLAIEDCYLIYLEKEDYKNVVQSVDMGKINRKIWFFEKFFLTGFTNESILKLSYFFVKKKFTLNQIIFSEGESIDGCFLIKKGEITVQNIFFLLFY